MKGTPGWGSLLSLCASGVGCGRAGPNTGLFPGDSTLLQGCLALLHKAAGQDLGERDAGLREPRAPGKGPMPEGPRGPPSSLKNHGDQWPAWRDWLTCPLQSRRTGVGSPSRRGGQFPYLLPTMLWFCKDALVYETNSGLLNFGEQKLQEHRGERGCSYWRRGQAVADKAGVCGRGRVKNRAGRRLPSSWVKRGTLWTREAGSGLGEAGPLCCS